MQQLNYHHLRYFWEVARHGSLRVAAERLNVSQPTISAQVKALEDSLEKQLFSRSGRGLKLTTAGRLVMDYAGEIFGLGGRMMDVLSGGHSGEPARLSVGVTDSFAKLFAWNLVRPVLRQHKGLFLQCMEAKSAELLGQLVTSRLDMVLSDEPAPSSLPIKAFSHLLGEAPVMFCATELVGAPLREGFPKSLDGAPMLLPAAQTAWRHQLDHWFEVQGVRPQVLVEFDDSAMMKTAAADGLGVVPVTMPMVHEAEVRFGLMPVGEAVGCRFGCYIITVERSLKHPAVKTLAKEARMLLKNLGDKQEEGDLGLQFSVKSGARAGKVIIG
jgi:LysR family transcriptional regulator, transcriptional activator of nhaA